MTVLDTAARRTSLRSCPLFAGLDSEALNVLAEAVVVETFAPGETVCAHGEPADRAFVIHRGSVAVLLPGGSTPIRHMGRHELVGEYGLFGGVRSSTLVAADEVVLLSVDYPRFQALCFRFPSILFGLLEATVRRLRAAEARLVANGPGNRDPQG
jgi:CRP-like cAMP-binding protein